MTVVLQQLRLNNNPRQCFSLHTPLRTRSGVSKDSRDTIACLLPSCLCPGNTQQMREILFSRVHVIFFECFAQGMGDFRCPSLRRATNCKQPARNLKHTRLQENQAGMWQVAGDVARSAGRFARRHRRAIVVGGVVGAAACVYHSMKKALKEV